MFTKGNFQLCLKAADCQGLEKLLSFIIWTPIIISKTSTAWEVLLNQVSIIVALSYLYSYNYIKNALYTQNWHFSTLVMLSQLQLNKQ